MENQVFRDPSCKHWEEWRVAFKGHIQTPSFNSKGAAAAFLSSLEHGIRKPEVKS